MFISLNDRAAAAMLRDIPFVPDALLVRWLIEDSWTAAPSWPPVEKIDWIQIAAVRAMPADTFQEEEASECGAEYAYPARGCPSAEQTNKPNVKRNSKAGLLMPRASVYAKHVIGVYGLFADAGQCLAALRRLKKNCGV